LAQIYIFKLCHKLYNQFLWKSLYFPLLYLFVSVKLMKVKPDKTLDCLGLYCPEPVFRTRMELDNMKAGEVLEILADDPAAEEDIPSLMKRLGQEVLSVSKEGDTIRVLVKKVK
jgi:TusA-related sulfurtransferase